jgi:predicted nucleotidyltransferase
MTIQLKNHLGANFEAKLLKEFCLRWMISELAVFGSVLRDDFRPESDLDILVTFSPEAPWSLWDLVKIKEELSALAGRPVDLVERKAVKNPFRQKEIFNHLEVLYAA